MRTVASNYFDLIVAGAPGCPESPARQRQPAKDFRSRWSARGLALLCLGLDASRSIRWITTRHHWEERLSFAT